MGIGRRGTSKCLVSAAHKTCHQDGTFFRVPLFCQLGIHNPLLFLSAILPLPTIEVLLAKTSWLADEVEGCTRS